MRPIQSRNFSEASRNASRAREGVEQHIKKAINYNIQNNDEATIMQENVIQENVMQENVIQEDVIQENVIQEDVMQENVIQKDVMQEDVMQEDVMQEESSYKDKIPEWKKLHGKIFKSTIDGQDYVWMKIKRSVYVEIMNHKEESEDAFYKRQELIVRKCVLFPKNIDTLIETNGGLATTLSDEIIFKSGFDIQSTIEL